MGEHLEPPLTSLSITHVYYNPGDPISLLSAWLALLPIAVMTSYAAVFWAQREIELLMMVAGQLGCELLNYGLKRLFKEARPKLSHGKGYGMPSSHSQFASYFAVYITLWLFLRNRYLPLGYRSFFSVLAILTAAAVASSRIYLSYHTPRQVIVGVAAGVIFAIFWFAFTGSLRSTTYKFFGHTPWDWVMWAGRILRVKDMCLEVDLVEHAWHIWYQRRNAYKKE